jgi:hypothetical protein
MSAKNPAVQTLLKQLADPKCAPVVPVTAEIFDTAVLRNGLRNANWYVATLDRAAVFSKDTLMHALYQSGEFPATFGFNWDALVDALCDYCWLENVQGIALLWRKPRVLQTRAPEVYDTFLDILAEAGEKRLAAGIAPLRILTQA